MKRSLATILFATFALAGCAARPAPLATPKPILVAATKEPLPPAANVEDLVDFEAKAANKFVRERDGGSMVVRLRIDAKALKNAARPPINLGLVVDTSGSMEGAAIEDARAACISLVDTLAEGDRLSVVAFDSEAHVLLPSTRLSKENMGELRARIGAMKARGTTDLSGGLTAGLSEIMKSFQASGVNRMVLVSDGVPNEEAPVLPLARQARQQGISITSLGLGLDYNETLVGMIATESGGKYHYLKDSSKVASVFQDEVLRLSRAVGRGATVTLSPGPGVIVEDVVGLSWSRVGNKVNVVIGDLSEGESRDVVVRLAAPARRSGSVVELVDADLAFEDALSGGRRLSARAFVSARSSGDADEIDGARNHDVERAFARVALADKIVRAVGAARGGDLRLALSILDTAEKEAKAAQKELADAELDEKLKSLPQLRQSLPALAKQVAAVAAGPAYGLNAPQREDHAVMPVPNAPMVNMKPMAAAPSVVMETQADAMRTIQGQ